MGAIVNRDLSRRIRTVTGLTGHKQVVRHDMKLSAKIIHNLDAKNDLWQDGLPSEQVHTFVTLFKLLYVKYKLYNIDKKQIKV